jgi:hypothetical protein
MSFKCSEGCLLADRRRVCSLEIAMASLSTATMKRPIQIELGANVKVEEN